MIEKLPVFGAVLPVAATESNMQMVCIKLNEMIEALNQHEKRLNRIQGIREDQTPYDASIPRNREFK